MNERNVFQVEMFGLLCLMICSAHSIGCGFARPADVVNLDGGADGMSHVDAAPRSPPASCIGLPATCGVDRNGSCCASPLIPGGAYHRSYDLANDPASGSLAYPATVGSFRLDKYEVTVGRFRAFVEAGMGTQANPPLVNSASHAGIAGSGWNETWTRSLPANTSQLLVQLKCAPEFLQTWTDLPGSDENRPMTCLTWFEAMAFCAWDGGYLPTEAEWNYAAAGGDQQRAYPWSDTITPLTIDGSHASYFNGSDCVGDGIAGCTVTDLVAVGSKPIGDGRWGQSDLGGNVREWILDAAAMYQTPCIDCAELAPSAGRIVRGGAFNDPDGVLRSAARTGWEPGTSVAMSGVRCARPP